MFDNLEKKRKSLTFEVVRIFVIKLKKKKKKNLIKSKSAH